MKLTIERGDLLNALSHVQNVVERRNTIPILSNVLLQASNGELKLTATDLDIEAVDSADATVTREGAVTAPAGTLFDVVRKLPAGSDAPRQAFRAYITAAAGRSSSGGSTGISRDRRSISASISFVRLRSHKPAPATMPNGSSDKKAVVAKKA